MTPEITKILKETAALEKKLENNRIQLEKLVSALFMEWLTKGAWEVTARGQLTPNDGRSRADLKELVSTLEETRWGHCTVTLSNEKGEVYARIYMDDGDLTIGLEGDSLPPEYKVDLKALIRQQIQEELERAQEDAERTSNRVALLTAKLEKLQ